MAALTRGPIIEALTRALEPLPYVLAGWEGGSASFGRVDGWSDIDVQFIAEDERVKDALDAADAALAALSPIELMYELPGPTWHGHAQRFYRLRDAGEFLLVDLVVMKRSGTQRFLEPEQHGRALVLFDKAGLVVAPRFEPAPFRELLRRRVEALRVLFPLFQPFVKKELLRGNEVEALAAYHAYALRPLVELLRIRHDPLRHGFHVRYMRYDLPAEAQARLRALYYVADPGEIEAKRSEAERWFFEVLGALDVDALDLSKPAAERR